MNIYKTLDEARLDANIKSMACIAEIEHATEGRVFICVKAPLQLLKTALRHKPMPEIVRIIAEYKTKSDKQIQAEHDNHLSTECNCNRCSIHVDGHTAYNQMEWVRIGNLDPVKVPTYYCARCAQLLNAIGAGEHTEMDDRGGQKNENR
jgi:hypothetical protein